MSLAIQFTSPDYEKADVVQLASSNGWRLVSEWAVSLPGKYQSIKSLCENGEVGNTAMLAEQLGEALRDNPPGSQVKHTLDQLLERLGDGSPVETATVLD